MSARIVGKALQAHGVEAGAEAAFKVNEGAELAHDLFAAAKDFGIPLQGSDISSAARDAINLPEPEVAAAAPVRPAPGSRPTSVPGGPVPV